MFQKKICLLVGSLLLGIFLHAQESEITGSRFGLSILAGFNAAQIDGDDSGGFNKVGVHGGLRSDIFLAKKIELSLTIIFSQRGSRPDAKHEQFLSDFKFGLNYIQVPLMFTFKDWYQEEDDYHRVRAFSGFSYGRLISTNLDETAFDTAPELLQKNSFNFHIGAGYNFNRHIRLAFVFQRGIIPIYNPRNIAQPRVDRQLIDRTITFRLEYSL